MDAGVKLISALPTVPAQVAGGWSTEQVLLAGLSMFAVFYLVFRPMLKKRRSDPIAKQPSLSLSQQRTVEKQMQSLLVELSEMARQMNGQIDTRAAKLQALIDDADRRIARLESASSSKGVAPAAVEPEFDEGHLDRPVPPRATPPASPEHQQVYALSDEGRDVEQIAAELDRPKGEVELILALRRQSGSM